MRRAHRNATIDRHIFTRIRAPGNEWANRIAIERDTRGIERIVVGAQHRPAGRRFLRLCKIGCRRCIGGDDARRRPGFDRHIAERHPLFHVECFDCAARVLEHVTRPAPEADGRNDGERQILRTRRWVESAGDLHVHHLGSLQNQTTRKHRARLRRRADAQRKRAERSKRTGVAIPATDRRSGPHVAALRDDHVADTAIAQVVEANTLAFRPRAQHLRLNRRCRIFRWCDVIVDRNDAVAVVQSVAILPLDRDCPLRRRDLMRDDAIHEDERIPTR